ncbi:hypothetical protein DR78_426 [Francisella philomiragia]|uniref:Uncharacterized protein n=1 Tax=Francisella philomiragia TaxID=28110 RepID=A0AAW3DBZ7_9GAMM|nr:hypothetical protein DR78_426 [Francisella philomiragia]
MEDTPLTHRGEFRTMVVAQKPTTPYEVEAMKPWSAPQLQQVGSEPISGKASAPIEGSDTSGVSGPS